MDVTLIVDGANVMGSRADGWWRDRAGAMARLHGELAALAVRGIRGPVPGDRPAPVPGDQPAPGDGDRPAPGDGDRPAPGDVVDATNEPGPVGAPEAGEDNARWYPHVFLVVEGRARKMLELVSPAPAVRVIAARGEGDDEIADLAGRLTGARVVVTADRELRRRSVAAGAAVAGPSWLIRQFG
jgi:8-oxo-dGTP diphosphatase